MTSNGLNCNRDALIAWLDDSLTQEARARLRGHLIACDACKSQLKSLESTLELAQSAFQPSAMGSFEARAFVHKVRGRIAANQHGVWRKILSPALGGGFVSGAVVGALALFVALGPVADPGSGTHLTEEEVLASAADSVVGNEVGDIDTIDAIDDYLLDTASEQELFSEMQSLIGEEDLLALLEEY
jgi:anti-sigma factor RsiW